MDPGHKLTQVVFVGSIVHLPYLKELSIANTFYHPTLEDLPIMY
jgi:hypothetical protein